MPCPGLTTRARPLLEHALADRALAPVAGRLLAESHLSEGGDLVAAEAALTVAAGAAPQDPDVAATLARLRQAQGRYAEAHAALRALAAARPGDAAVHESLASVALTLATLANARGDAADRTAWATRAAEDFREARRDAGDLPAYAAGEARALEMAGNLAGAEAALLHAVELGGDAPAARVTLMEFYERTGQRQKADAERRKAGDAAAPQKRRLRPLPPSR
ncbi:MAG: tetratricopeptide repeat protein [Deltaproteobacteria bacterium]|nr:tetratricopeptide repeat protein [Deltaproteobacteria bacterium]